MTAKTERFTCDLNVTDMVVTYTYQNRDGEKWIDMASKEFNFYGIPAEVSNQVALYGLRALLADRTTDAKKMGIVGADKLEWMEQVYENLVAGNFTSKRAGGANQVCVYLAAVIADKKSISVTKATELLKALDKDMRAQLATKFKDEVAELKRDEGGEQVDLDDLF